MLNRDTALAAMVFFFLSFLKLYIYYYVYKKMESRISYPMIGDGVFPLLSAIKGWSSRNMKHMRMATLMQILIYLCANTIILSGHFLELKSIFLTCLILFQFALFFFLESQRREVTSKKITQSLLVVIPTILTFYAMNVYFESQQTRMFHFFIPIVACVNIFMIINFKSFFLNDLEEILFYSLLVNFFSYSVFYHFGYGIIASELLSIFLLALKKCWEPYKQDDPYPFEMNNMEPVLLSVALVFFVKVGL